MDTVDKIYELIKQDNSINTFNNNRDLFLDFYRNCMFTTIKTNKVIEIYKYLLPLNIDDYDMPILHSKIVGDFNFHEQRITQGVYFKDKKTDEETINSLYKLMEDYEFFKQFKGVLSEQHFIRDYTASMMVILNKDFFNLENEDIKKMMNYIKNNKYLVYLCENGLGDISNPEKKILDKDYIYQYCSRYLFTENFVNYDNIEDDYLLKSLKECKIKDPNLLKYIFKNIKPEYLFINDDLSKLIDILEVLDDEVDRIILFKKVYNDLLNDRSYDLVLDSIMNDDRIHKYLSEEDIKNVLFNISAEYPPGLTAKQVLYLYENVDNKLLKYNIKENLKHNDWTEEERKQISDLVSDVKDINYSHEEAISILDGMFKGNKISELKCFYCLKTLIREFTKSDDLVVYLSLYTDNCLGGYFSSDSKAISVDLRKVINLVKCENIEKNPKSLGILDTIYHESQHFLQREEMGKTDIRPEIYTQYKERVLRNLLPSYYEDNYRGISYESEARVIGAKMTELLLKNNFPYLTNCIEYYNNLALKEEKTGEDEKKIFELSDKISVDEAIEKLICISPSILDEYDKFLIEYNKDGSKKDQEIKMQ